MGMFSYICKGCGHELITGEDVRLNGCRQKYNGYGGSTADNDDYEPVAWHQRCYEQASDREKLDEGRSHSAPNQGFGPAKLEFMRDYDPAAETKYYSRVTGYYSNEDHTKHQSYTFYLTNAGKLEDEEAYTAQEELHLDAKYKKIEEAVAGGMPESEYDALSERLNAEIEAQIGVNPSQNLKLFDSVEEAVAAADALLGELPVCLEGTYELTVFGQQSKHPPRCVSGAVYERIVSHRWDRSGHYNDWKRLEGLETELRYQIGVKSADKLKEEESKRDTIADHLL